MSYFYWTRAHRRDYANQISYVSSPDFISQQRNIFNDYEICMYLQYENEPDGFFYTRSVLGNVSATGSFAGRSLGAKRNLLNTMAGSDSATRALRKVILKTENLGFLDSVKQLLLIIRSCFSSAETAESLSLKSDYKRILQSVVEDEETINRQGESFRGFRDDVEIEARPFTSRLFFRTVQTVVGFWDWLRGKIREANNVVTLYSPMDLEITLESKI